jgi:hypothetical protein
MSLNTSARYEPVAWLLTTERIGWGLRERYRRVEDLPPRLLLLIKKLDEEPEISARDNSPAQSRPALTTQRFRGSALNWHFNRPPWQRDIPLAGD